MWILNTARRLIMDNVISGDMIVRLCGHSFSLKAIAYIYIFDNIFYVLGFNGEISEIALSEGDFIDESFKSSMHLINSYILESKKINSCLE